MGGHAFQARRAFDLAALTARLKPCPSTTVPIPAFFRKLLEGNAVEISEEPQRCGADIPFDYSQQLSLP